MERKADRIVWALTVAAALVATVVVGATAGNGDFEQGARGWSVLQRDSTRRDAPRVADGVNLPDPPGPAAGRSHAAVLGDDPDTFFPAANPSVLYRRFRLDDEPFDHGVLAFDARLWSQGDDVAAVVVTSKLGVRAWRIRPQRPGGAPERRVAGFLREGPVVVEFVLF